MLPDFKHLNSDYDAKGVRDALKPLIEELGKDKPEKMAGDDAANPGNELLKKENEAAGAAVEKAGDLAKEMVEKLLSEDAPPPPPGQPSAHDLLFYSATAYENLDKALWHTMR